MKSGECKVLGGSIYIVMVLNMEVTSVTQTLVCLGCKGTTLIWHQDYSFVVQQSLMEYRRKINKLGGGKKKRIVLRKIVRGNIE